MALGRIGVNATISSLTDPSAAAQACNVYYDQCRDNLFSNYVWPWTKKRAALNVYSGAEWAAATTYALGDLVEYRGAVYRASAVPTVGTAPPDNTGAWTKITRDGWAYVAQVPTDVISPFAIWDDPTRGSTVASKPLAPTPSVRNPRSDQRIPFQIESSLAFPGYQDLLCDVQYPILHYAARIEETTAYTSSFIDTLAWALAIELGGALRADPKVVQHCKAMYKMAFGEAVSSDQRGQREDQEPTSEFEAAREA
jgi:hypothetical protein